MYMSNLRIGADTLLGDGNTDDTTALQDALNRAVAEKKVVFFDHGVYKITRTLYVPPGSRLVSNSLMTSLSSLTSSRSVRLTRSSWHQEVLGPRTLTQCLSFRLANLESEAVSSGAI